MRDCKKSSATRGITAISRSSISKPWASGATSQNPSAGDATGRRSPTRAPLSIAIVDAFAVRGACACCACAANAWSGPSRISTKPVGMRRVFLRGHTNILKRVLIHTGGFNLGLLMRQLIGVGTPRGLQGRVHAVMAALVALIRPLWDLMTGYRRPCDSFTRADSSIARCAIVTHRRARNGFHHGLLAHSPLPARPESVRGQVHHKFPTTGRSLRKQPARLTNRQREHRLTGRAGPSIRDWFLEKGGISIDAKSKRIAIHYDRYHKRVASLLKEVLAIQRVGRCEGRRRVLTK